MTLAVTDGSQKFFREHPDYKRWSEVTPTLGWKTPEAGRRAGDTKVTKIIFPEQMRTPTKEWGVSYATHTNPNSINVRLNDRKTLYCLNKKELEAWVARMNVQKEYAEALRGKGNEKDLRQVIVKADKIIQSPVNRAVDFLRPQVSDVKSTSSRRLQIAGAAVAVSSVALLALNSPYIRSLFEEEAPQVDSLWQVVDSWEKAKEYFRS